ncbi:hypothetical protein BD289DRAFT_265640 [Coniella lustricola]|uniref:Uncharacterized protein n=1 Tax=Coniella lustricola TaxID=2025994 RepID=A0A2T3A793_9PEZI|nr:hypothetical protein BD289DRAFT_265640 [Coniella lustricola]
MEDVSDPDLGLQHVHSRRYVTCKGRNHCESLLDAVNASTTLKQNSDQLVLTKATSKKRRRVKPTRATSATSATRARTPPDEPTLATPTVALQILAVSSDNCRVSSDALFFGRRTESIASKQRGRRERHKPPSHAGGGNTISLASRTTFRETVRRGR